MAHLGDFDTSTVVYGKFTTYRPSTGATFTLGGTPALSVYKDNSVTQSTTGVTLTADFDAVTGLNHFAIDTSADGTFYSAGSFFDIVITTGTVDSVSVTGSVVGSFTLRKNSALKPATAGRTLVVDAAGLADANTVKVGPSGSGTAQTAGDIPARLPAALVSGRMDSSVGAMAANTLTAAATAADFGAEMATAVWTDTTAGDFTVALSVGKSVMNGVSLGTGLTVASVSGAVGSVTGAVGSVTGNVGGNVVGSVGSVTGAVGSVTGITASDVGAIKAKTDNLPAAPAAVSDIPTAAANATAVLTTAMTESYRADGATGTLAQAQYEILAHLGESSIVSTTKTIKKIDGTTTAATFTLDSDTAPTSITRAT